MLANVLRMRALTMPLPASDLQLPKHWISFERMHEILVSTPTYQMLVVRRLGSVFSPRLARATRAGTPAQATKCEDLLVEEACDGDESDSEVCVGDGRGKGGLRSWTR